MAIIPDLLHLSLVSEIGAPTTVEQILDVHMAAAALGLRGDLPFWKLILFGI